VATNQRHYCDAADQVPAWKEPAVLHALVGSEEGVTEIAVERTEIGELVNEKQPVAVVKRAAGYGQQVSQFVIRVRKYKADSRETEGLLQTGGKRFQEMGQIFSTEQGYFALMAAPEGLFTEPGFLRQLMQFLSQPAVFGVEALVLVF